MNSPLFITIGKDRYWQEALKKAIGKEYEIFQIFSNLGFHGSLGAISIPTVDSIIIVDVSGLTDIKPYIIKLREMGCQFIVIVAADPSVNEAREILRDNISFDYWIKSYDERMIKHYIKRCLNERKLCVDNKLIVNA